VFSLSIAANNSSNESHSSLYVRIKKTGDSRGEIATRRLLWRRGIDLMATLEVILDKISQSEEIRAVEQKVQTVSDVVVLP
jgi:hypothetical protein